MARCNRCGYRFATLDDEADMHECPRCGWGPPESIEDEPDDEGDEA